MIKKTYVALADRYAEAFTGENVTPTFAVVDLNEALAQRHNWFAHFTAGVCYTNDTVPEDQPRFSVHGTYPEDWRFEFSAVAVDVDAPGKQATDEWWDAEVELLEHTGPLWESAFWYRTRGGYRLVWSLPAPVGKSEYIQTLTNLYAALREVGIKPDEFYDWTRVYMLPQVMRDGKPQNLPRCDKPLADLPALATVERTAVSGFDAVIQARMSPFAYSEWPKGERNSRMFAAVKEVWRKLDGIDDEFLLAHARILNEQRCEDDPMPDDELVTIVTNVMRYTPPPAPVAAPVAAAVLPPVREKVYVHKGHLPSAINAIRDILARNPGAFYKQSSRLVRLARQEGGSFVIEELNKPMLREILERKCAFMTTKITKDELVEIPVDLPRDLLDVIAARTDDENILELQEVLTTPTLTPDGSVLTTTGYCAQLQLYYAPTPDVSAVHVGETMADAHAALRVLQDLIADFPFAAECHRATALAALITPIVRSAIDGPTPLFIFDSTTPGSGKSLLADVTALLATGQCAPRMALTGEEELEKRVTALLSTGARTVLIDNVDKPLGGAVLDALLTSDQWTGRILGSTKMIKLRARAVWMATGNNVQIQGDLARRALRVYLNPKMERPEERTHFQYGDLLAYTRAHRAKLVSAALTIARAYIAAGEPPVNVPPQGSFEAWSRLVRQPLVWLGVEDPLLSQAELRADNTVVSWGTFMAIATAVWGDDSFTAKDVYDAAFNSVRKKPGVKSDVWTALEAAMEELCGARASVRQVSWLLRKWQHRIIDGMALKKREGRDRVKGNLYYVDTAANVAPLVPKVSPDGHASEDATVVSFFSRPNMGT